MLRRTLKRVAFLRSGFHLLLALTSFVRDEDRSFAGFDQLFARQTDPWRYNSEANQERFFILLQILDRVRRECQFKRAAEIGCAEGAFTELLATRCESLLAVDFTPLALERARKRCSEIRHLRFESFDLRRDHLRGTFDLIVVTDVLAYIHRPSALRAVRAKLVDALDPGGFLLFGEVRQSDAVEFAWWAKFLIRGGTWIGGFLAQHESLAAVQTADTMTHVFTLFRKV